MKKLLLCVLLLAGAPVGMMTAQHSPAGTQPNFVFDDDGGAVQIVPAGPASAGARKFHGGFVLRSVQQVSIFLGGGWGNAEIRSRENTL